MPAMELAVQNLISAVRGWLAPSLPGDPAAQDNYEAAAQSPAVGSPAKLRTLAAISSAFVDHDLHLSGENLLLVHAMLTGQDPDLLRQYQTRLASGLAIDDNWLAQIEVDFARRKSAQLDRLVTDFEGQLAHFHNSASEARRAAEGYGDELTQTIANGLETKADVTMLGKLAKQMVAQSRSISLAMKDSEQQTAMLKRRLTEARRAAETDALTGLPNRRAFEDEFARQVGQAEAKRSSLVISFCDIDNFKQINDRHGHDAGDRVLRRVGTLLGKLGTGNSFVSRHGGEEFVLLFPEIGLAKAVKRLDRARRELGEAEFLNRDNGAPIGRVSFSAGIVEVRDFANPRQALHAADQALYRAKSMGKNCIVSG